MFENLIMMFLFGVSIPRSEGHKINFALRNVIESVVSTHQFVKSTDSFAWTFSQEGKQHNFIRKQKTLFPIMDTSITKGKRTNIIRSLIDSVWHSVNLWGTLLHWFAGFLHSGSTAPEGTKTTGYSLLSTLGALVRSLPGAAFLFSRSFNYQSMKEMSFKTATGRVGRAAHWLSC